MATTNYTVNHTTDELGGTFDFENVKTVHKTLTGAIRTIKQRSRQVYSPVVVRVADSAQLELADYAHQCHWLVGGWCDRVALTTDEQNALIGIGATRRS